MRHLDPIAAFALLQENPRAVLIDCRSEIEHLYVGHPVGAEHVAWQEAPEWEIDPRFADKVRRRLGGDPARPVLLLCRSGRRSEQAAAVLEAAGFTDVVNILEGFEGPLDADDHRGTLGGWRFRGLPWQQS